MKQRVKSGVNYVLATIFVILGFIGLLLPFVPQVFFFAVALIILSFEIDAVNQYIEKNLNKEGQFGKIYFSIRDRLEKILK